MTRRLQKLVFLTGAIAALEDLREHYEAALGVPLAAIANKVGHGNVRGDPLVRLVYAADDGKVVDERLPAGDPAVFERIRTLCGLPEPEVREEWHEAPRAAPATEKSTGRRVLDWLFGE